jgi:carbonic anhydrase
MNTLPTLRRTSHAAARLAVAAFVAAIVVSVRADEPASVSPDLALKRLEEGNQRFVANGTKNAVGQSQRLADLVKAQHPIAVVVCCSDSRVGPEIVLDQGLGDIFVIRTAGHVVDKVELGTIEYAVEHLGPSLILVLGHQNCGAVKTAVSGEEAPAHVHDVVESIKPAVTESRNQPGDPVDNAVRANVRNVVKQLKDTGPFLKERVKAGKLKIVGGRYDLESGKMELIVR